MTRPKLYAYACTVPGYGQSTQVAATPSKARSLAYHLARELGHRPAYAEVRARRDPTKDDLAEAEEDRGLYWRDTRRYKRLEAQAEAFNAAYLVGTAILVIGCDEAQTVFQNQPTRLRTPAWVASLNGVLASVEGQAGGFDLKYLQPIPDYATT